MRPLITYPLLLAALGLSACTDKTPAPVAGSEKPAPKDILATVNGKPIARSALEAPFGMRRRPPDPRQVDELITREVVRQYAEREHLADKPGFAEKLDNVMRQALSQMAVEDYLQTHPVTDAAVQAEYSDRYAPDRYGEIKARHILVDGEDAAKSLIQQLQGGGNFADLAKQNSKDPGSKDKGGDLGWFEPKAMDPAFAAAVTALKNGDTTAVPVQSRFGWHVIQREDFRQKPVPAFDAVKGEIRSTLQRRQMQSFMDDLRKAAVIVRNPSAPMATAQPAAPAPPPKAP